MKIQTVEQKNEAGLVLNPFSRLSENGQDCRAVEIHGVTSLKTAITEMNAVATRNTRVKNPAYHFILSWPEHETPADADIFDTARQCLKNLNLADHQYMIAIHDSTDNIHCHVAANRVHPETGIAHHIENATAKLHLTARQAEIDHNWTHDNGIYIVKLDEEGKKAIVRNPELNSITLEPVVNNFVSRGEYIGSVVDVKDGVVFQNAGRGEVVRHDLSQFEKVPVEGDKLHLKYVGGVMKVLEALSHDQNVVSVSLNSR